MDIVHGIACLYNKKTRDIVLWNPATRQWRLLPKSADGNPKKGYAHWDFVGLGFDVENKDYKVIQVSFLVPRNNYGVVVGIDVPRKVQLYSLTTDSWSLNGIYFHAGTDYTTDPNDKEKYTGVIQPPENNFHRLVSVGDKLACITATRGYDMWTELYRVEPRTYGFGCMHTISWNGKFGLCRGKPLTCYNSVTNEFRDLGCGEGIELLEWANNFKESLVSVDATTNKAISSSNS
ncbi:hypothetical protein MKX01_027509 [Papaver californicum]|nr:hypothetical protein MKX01_027509 [Papaver californicum]